MEFTELNLHPDLQRGITEAEYITCMPVQEQVLTSAFGGQDLYVQSQTGTGKTAAFLIVIFQRLLSEPLLNGKKAIIMVPTRELAVQVEEEAKLLGKYLPFKIGSFYGGVGYTEQQRMLRDNVQILVGTPGRVLDLNSSGQMNLMEIAFLILDEADRMFDMGFYPDLRKLIRVVPPADRRQTMLFSATLNNWVKNLAWEYTKTPLEIEIAPETVTVEEIDQILYHVPSDDKMKLLLGIMEREQPESALIFCNTKRYAEIVAKRLRINGIECEFIMGDLPQSKRLKIIDDVKAGKINFLVATDVAARGLDIEDLAMVVNYDLPVESENYVHRIGRTARAGKSGKAITLASEQDVYELPAIERYIGKKIPAQVAGEDLYAEDKSAGMRIHTDYYEDGPGPRDGDRRRGGRGGRGESRERAPRREGPHGRGGFGGGSDRSGRGTGGSAGGHDGPGRSSGFGNGHTDGHTGGSDRSGGFPGSAGDERPARSPGGRGGRNQRPSREDGNAPAENRNLSKLSFEERMAYYKQKYDGDGTQRGRSGGEDRGRREAAGHTGNEGRNRRNRAGKGRSAGGRERAAGKGGNQGASGKAALSAAMPAEKPAASSKPEKGLFSRILGLFKKD